MSIDLTEPTTPPSSRLGKRKALHSDLFTKKLFVLSDLPPAEHKDTKTHTKIKKINISTFLKANGETFLKKITYRGWTVFPGKPKPTKSKKKKRWYVS